MAASIGIPIKVLHEAEGHIVTLETSTGEVFRGKLLEAEDNMNCHMSDVSVTHRDGRVKSLERVFIRGSKVRFMILPDMLKNAPMFKRVGQKGQGQGLGLGARGKAAMMRGRGQTRGRGTRRGTGEGTSTSTRGRAWSGTGTGASKAH